MDKKEEANNYFKEGKYTEALNIYNDLILDENIVDIDMHSLLSNRSATNIKLGNFNDALTDATNCIKLKPDWGKAWGRLGAALYGLNKYDDALVAYNKANEIEPCDIYTNMIADIKNKFNVMKLNIIKNGLPEEIKNGLPSEFKNGLPNEFKNGLPNEFKNGLPNEFKNGLPSEFKNGLPNEFKNGLPNEFKNGLPEEIKNSEMGNLFLNMFDKVVDNPKIMEKLTDPTFQNKVLSMQTNPIDALKDKEVMGMMMEMMKGMNFNN